MTTERAIKLLAGQWNAYGDCMSKEEYEAYKMAIDALKKCGANDAVPVVKCKDCVYFDKHNGTNDWNGWCDKDEIYAILSDEFYCGFAERKVEE